MQAPDYGPRARIGVAVPQANPTVEPEMRDLLPRAIGVYATRLTHSAPQVETRLQYYIRNMPAAIGSFGSLSLAAFGFGCTGSSYLAGPELETRLTTEAAAQCAVPVVTAAQALREAMALRGAKRIAVVSPYPEALAEAGYAYWRAVGLDLVQMIRVDPALADTHAIYELTSADALAAIRSINTTTVDCIVVSGTGMPTVAALRAVRPSAAIPVISSNLCLAWALLRRAAPDLAPAQPTDLLS